MMKQRQINTEKQGGVVLVISMVILLLMTLIGISAMRVSGLEEKMAGNSRNRNIAFQSAESALREAEKILAGNPLPVFNNTKGYYSAASTPKWKTVQWNDPDQIIVYKGDPLSGVKVRPSYIIEELPVMGRRGSLEAGIPGVVRYFRITARGTGGDETAVVMLQSVFRR